MGAPKMPPLPAAPPPVPAPPQLPDAVTAAMASGSIGAAAQRMGYGGTINTNPAKPDMRSYPGKSLLGM